MQGFRVSGFRSWGSNLGFGVEGVGLTSRVERVMRASVSGPEFRVPVFGIRDSGFGFLASDFGFWVLGFGFLALGFGFHISGLGFTSRVERVMWASCNERAGTRMNIDTFETMITRTWFRVLLRDYLCRYQYIILTLILTILCEYQE